MSSIHIPEHRIVLTVPDSVFFELMLVRYPKKSTKKARKKIRKAAQSRVFEAATAVRPMTDDEYADYLYSQTPRAKAEEKKRMDEMKKILAEVKHA